MGKELVIIGLVVLCLAFSVAEKKTKRNAEDSDDNEYVEIDVGNNEVKNLSQQVLTAVRENRTDCPNATLIEVTKAKYKSYHDGDDFGSLWEFELSFKNGSVQIMNCTEKAWEFAEDVANRPRVVTYNHCNCTNIEEII